MMKHQRTRFIGIYLTHYPFTAISIYLTVH